MGWVFPAPLSYHPWVQLANQQFSASEMGVSVVIPHRAGLNILRACLESIEWSDSAIFEVIVVDTGCSDGSIEEVRTHFPRIRVVEAGTEVGFARGCNLGIRRARFSWILLLNDDAILHPNCLMELLRVAEGSSDIGAVQPKVLSAAQPERFDAAGAAGGYIDRFGYPLARGRIFDSVEEDHGQYDNQVDIFWGAGVCLLIRKAAINKVGNLDEAFFAHMEEIDLCWRMWLTGWRTVFVPEAQTHHVGGATLARGSKRKVFLNHRNSLWMMMKNLSIWSLFKVLPIRIGMDMAAVGFHLVGGRLQVAAAVGAALCAAIIGIPRILVARVAVQRLRSIPDSGLEHLVFPSSIVVAFFLRGIRQFSDLGWKGPDGS